MLKKIIISEHRRGQKESHAVGIIYDTDSLEVDSVWCDDVSEKIVIQPSGKSEKEISEKHETPDRKSQRKADFKEHKLKLQLDNEGALVIPFGVAH